jgi:integrase
MATVTADWWLSSIGRITSLARITVGALLGHRDIATTLRLYGHAYAKRHVAAAARMDAILSGRAVAN